jgi:hypothetical protein
MGLCKSTQLANDITTVAHAHEHYDSTKSFRDKYKEFASRQHMTEVYECIIAIGIYMRFPGPKEKAFKEIYDCYVVGYGEVNISSELRDNLRSVYENGPYTEESLDPLLRELKQLVKQNYISR